MDDRQRYDDLEEVFRLAINGLLANAWTGIPGYIVSFDPASVTATVQIGIQGQGENPDGSTSQSNYPVLEGVPVEFPGGGGSRLTFPVAPGDECWIAFSCRAMGAWKASGGIQPTNDPRMHHIADAVCRIGPMSQANKLSNVSTSTVQLRSANKETYIELDPTGQIVNVVAPGGMTITAPTLHLINGALTVDQTITAAETISSSGGDVLAGSISLTNHKHTGVQSGSSVTGPPEG
ncbi:Gp138 family membrane-puncturing spike protein [Dyella mobilis]|uniref:Phage protein Gp138 N-terminal domain-containing protein n=1 Tax=Dyella mobilis TaxID=1849582 RepID=A0ABS2KK76_9GAMM|nr:Gp138 family membrane-puncturing spike protein [Dyella mobilis]MBM7131546.1 hypothetical protein [Dyella mobilis]GLQ96483.1 hypothetical protein GCM10007863_09010 [Dyella mobilis]